MSEKVGGVAVVTLLVGIIFLGALLPEIVTQVQDVNTTGWTFTGYAGATTLWLLIPFVIIAGSIIKIVKDLIS